MQYVWSTIPLVVKLVEQSTGLPPILVIRSTVPPGTTLKWEADVRAKTSKPFHVRQSARRGGSAVAAWWLRGPDYDDRFELVAGVNA